LRIHRIENREIAIEVDLDTGVITGIIDKVAGVNHLFSRKPELETKKPGMGIYILEPIFCQQPTETRTEENKIIFKCQRQDLEISWGLELLERKIRYFVEAQYHGDKEFINRFRVVIYSACGRGGFWGDPGAEGAGYSCRYYVNYGFESSRETFSSVMIPSTTRGFRFEKHSYKTKLFPEARWIATVDKVLKTGLVIKPKRDDYLIVVEDQFFNIEINIITPRKRVSGGEKDFFELDIIPVRDLERIDYVSDELILGVESPSIAFPGERYRGRVVIYPLDKISCEVNGYIEYDKNMASLGRRGYCIDQVKRGFRREEIKLEKNFIDSSPGNPWVSKFESINEISFEMDKELYEIPDLVVEICGGKYIAKRSFTIQPEAPEILKKIPERIREYFYNKYIYDNYDVESEYRDTTALSELYLYVSKPPRLRKILNVGINDVRPSKSITEKIMKYLEHKRIREIIEKIVADPSNKLLIFNTNPLDIVFLYIVERDPMYIDLLKRVFENITRHWFREDLVGYYTAIHGGAGASRFIYWALSLDLIDDFLTKDLKDDLAYMLNEIGREIYKITNVWAGNWEFAEAAGLLAIALKVDGVYTDVFREKALTILETLQYTFLRDGGSVELAAGYHHYDLESIMSGAEILYYSGDNRLYRRSLGDDEPIIKKALIWLWNILTPYNTTPALEDTNEGYVAPDLYVLGYLRYRDERLGYVAKRLWSTRPYLYNPLTLLALALSNEDPLEKEFTEFRRDKILRMDPSGRFIYRESEDPESFFLILDYGPHGAWHGHPDKLSFEVYRRGEAIIVDAGSGGYYNPLHWSWNRRTIAHNTVTREDQDHDEIRGELINIETAEDRVRAVFTANIYRDTVLVRELTLLDKKEVKEIDLLDKVIGEGLYRWNIHVRGVCENKDPRIVCRTQRNGIEIISFDEKWVISEGFRGDSEKINYLYRIKKISGQDFFRTKIIIY